jgi:hypothetical protein
MINKIKTLSEYLSAVAIELKCFESSTGPTWFRGVSNCEHKLIPNIYRNFNSNDYSERELTRDFKLLSRQFIKNDMPQSDIEWMFLMQHYGLSTRLLDWSESSLIALFFAVKYYEINCDAAVWIFDPFEFNVSINKMDTVPASTNRIFLKNYLLDTDGPKRIGFCKAEKPMAIRAVKNSTRILAQKGTFTIHGKEILAIEDYVTNFNESGNKKFSLMKELYYSGISHSVIFPEIDMVSEELKFRYSRRFLESS